MQFAQWLILDHRDIVTLVILFFQDDQSAKTQDICLKNSSITLPIHNFQILLNQSTYLANLTSLKDRWAPDSILLSDECISERDIRILSQEEPVDNTIDLSSLIQTASYLIISRSEEYVLSLLTPLLQSPFCNTDNHIIPALYFCKFRLQWQTLYDLLFKQLKLISFNVNPNWSYTSFKRAILRALRSHWPSHDTNIWGYCSTCHSYSCTFLSHPFDPQPSHCSSSPWFR